MAYIVYKDNTSHYVFAQRIGTASEINPNRIIENQPSYVISAIKEQVRLASPLNINLSAQHTSLDGITLNNGDRVLLVGQTSPKENGMYFWDAGHRMFFRAQDCFELKAGMLIMVEEGLSLADSLFFLATNNPIVVDETPLSFAQITGGVHALTHIYGASDPIDGDRLGIDWVPSNYTPDTSSPLVSAPEHLAAHLAGIDDKLAPGAIPHALTHLQGAVDVIDGDKLDITFIPSNYTRDISPPEVDTVTQLTAHLAGIDDKLVPGGILHASTHIQGAVDVIDGDKLEITYVPTHYVRDITPPEVDDVTQLTAHLAGIDDAIASASEDLQGTLVLGNITGGSDIVLSFGDALTAPEAVTLTIRTPDVTGVDDGGSISLLAGDGGGGGEGGPINVIAGDGDSNIGGNVLLRSGGGGDASTGGNSSLEGGLGGTTSGAGGNASVRGGSGGAPDGDGGDVRLIVGSAAGAGSDGIVDITGNVEVAGDVGVTGDMSVSGKLTVTGLIDPTGVIFDEATAPSTGSAKAALFISDGSSGLTKNKLYYRPELDGTPERFTAPPTSTALARVDPNSSDAVDDTDLTTAFITVQAAVDACPVDGTVLIYPKGTPYDETVYVRKNLHLLGMTGKRSDGSADVVSIVPTANRPALFVTNATLASAAVLGARQVGLWDANYATDLVLDPAVTVDRVDVSNLYLGCPSTYHSIAAVGVDDGTLFLSDGLYIGGVKLDQSAYFRNAGEVRAADCSWANLSYARNLDYGWFERCTFRLDAYYDPAEPEPAGGHTYYLISQCNLTGQLFGSKSAEFRLKDNYLEAGWSFSDNVVVLSYANRNYGSATFGEAVYWRGYMDVFNGAMTFLTGGTNTYCELRGGWVYTTPTDSASRFGWKAGASANAASISPFITKEGVGQINGLAEKVTPVAADILVLEDSAASYAKKKVQVGNLPGGSGTDPDAIHDNVAGEIAAVALKATPVSADLLLIEDSAAANAKKRVTVGSLPGGAVPTLSSVLAAGNTTGVTSIVMSAGTWIQSAAGNILELQATNSPSGFDGADLTATAGNAGLGGYDGGDVVLTPGLGSAGGTRHGKIVAANWLELFEAQLLLGTAPPTGANVGALFVDSADNLLKYRAQSNGTVYDLTAVGGAGSDTTAIHDNQSGEIAAVALKATPVSADLLLIEDSADSNNKKRVTVGSLPGGSGTDPDAIHDNVSGEISLVTEKVTPVSADLILIEDSAASNAKKRVQIGNLPGGSGTDPDAIHDNVAGEIAAVALKATPVSADLLLIEDSADSNNKKRVTVGSLPGGSGTDPDAIHDNVSGEISAITEKVAPVNADLLLIEDSADSNSKRRVQLGNIPTSVAPATSWGRCGLSGVSIQYSLTVPFSTAVPWYQYSNSTVKGAPYVTYGTAASDAWLEIGASGGGRYMLQAFGKMLWIGDANALDVTFSINGVRTGRLGVWRWSGTTVLSLVDFETLVSGDKIRVEFYNRSLANNGSVTGGMNMVIERME